MMRRSMKTLANGLRGTAVIIAVLGLLDPAISLPWRDRPRVSVRLATPPDVFARGDALSAANAQREMAERVRARLAREFIVADENDRHSAVDALVFVGGFETDDPAAIADALDVAAVGGTNSGGASTGSTPASASVPATASAPASARAGTQARTDGLTPARVPIAAIVPAAASGPGVKILGVAAPRSAHLSSRVPITIALAARGLRGRSTIIAVRAAGLALARATHAWTMDDEQARIVLEVTPIRGGIAAFEVVVEAPTSGSAAAAAPSAANSAGAPDAAASGSSPGSAASAPATAAPATATPTNTAAPAEIAAHASVAVRITDQPLRVLFVEPRPSWTTRFVRLALAGDTRFRIDAQAQVSRGLSARTTDAPVRLTMAALAPFDAIIVGAPEQLAPADVEALRGFARTRGGLVVFAPDRAPQGAYVDLLPSDGFDERLLETPQLVAATRDDGAAASGELLGAMPVLASELALPRALRPGAVVLARLQGSAAQARPVVVAAPLGDGQVVFAGAMDAWRYRDRPQPRFDAFWRQVVFALGAQAPPPVDVTLDPQVVRPGAAGGGRAGRGRARPAPPAGGGGAGGRASLSPVLASPRGGKDADVRAAAVNAVAAGRAAAGGAPAGGSAPSATEADAASGAAEAVRLWPGDRPGEFRAILNAPAGAGVYAMSLNADSLATPAGAPLLVSTDEPRRSRSWEALRARVDAHGGLVVTEDRIDRAVEDLRRQMMLRTDRTPRHPWRSAWWIVPFAGCLGGEWLLRRRRGAA